MKRYLVFIYADYYPKGGMLDFHQAVDEFKLEAFEPIPDGWYVQVYDRQTQKIVNYFCRLSDGTNHNCMYELED